MKKILLALGAAGTVLVTMPMFAAFEAHVVNVTASIENALSVPTTPIQFGSVFPQEEIDEFISIGLSTSFLAQSRVDEVSYFIRQKPKCRITENNQTEGAPEFAQVTEDELGDFQCPEGYEKLPLLCPFLSKHETTPDGEGGENDIQPSEVAPFVNNGLNAFHGPIVLEDWNMSVADAWDVFGKLNKNGDDGDRWRIDLRVPCFDGSCAQDWPQFVEDESGVTDEGYSDNYKLDSELQGKLLGCDLWVEVNGIDDSTPAPEVDQQQS